MFREMRRKDRLMSDEDARALLAKADHGVLAVAGDDDYPYGVPVSFAFVENRIIFHCAKTGHKLDALKRNPKCSFTIIANDDIAPSEFGTYFSSVIAFGKARILTDEKEIYDEHMHIIKKYSGDFIPQGIDYFEKMKQATSVVVIDIEHLTGKAKVRAMG